jgi:hypothetical protein
METTQRQQMSIVGLAFAVYCIVLVAEIVAGLVALIFFKD